MKFWKHKLGLIVILTVGAGGAGAQQSLPWVDIQQSASAPNSRSGHKAVWVDNTGRLRFASDYVPGMGIEAAGKGLYSPPNSSGIPSFRAQVFSDTPGAATYLTNTVTIWAAPWGLPGNPGTHQQPIGDSMNDIAAWIASKGTGVSYRVMLYPGTYDYAVDFVNLFTTSRPVYLCGSGAGNTFVDFSGHYNYSEFGHDTIFVDWQGVSDLTLSGAWLEQVPEEDEETPEIWTYSAAVTYLSYNNTGTLSYRNLNIIPEDVYGGTFSINSNRSANCLISSIEVQSSAVVEFGKGNLRDGIVRNGGNLRLSDITGGSSTAEGVTIDRAPSPATYGGGNFTFTGASCSNIISSGGSLSISAPLINNIYAPEYYGLTLGEVSRIENVVLIQNPDSPQITPVTNGINCSISLKSTGDVHFKNVHIRGHRSNFLAPIYYYNRTSNLKIDDSTFEYTGLWAEQGNAGHVAILVCLNYAGKVDINNSSFGTYLYPSPMIGVFDGFWGSSLDAGRSTQSRNWTVTDSRFISKFLATANPPDDPATCVYAMSGSTAGTSTYTFRNCLFDTDTVLTNSLDRAHTGVEIRKLGWGGANGSATASTLETNANFIDCTFISKFPSSTVTYGGKSTMVLWRTSSIFSENANYVLGNLILKNCSYLANGNQNYDITGTASTSLNSLYYSGLGSLSTVSSPVSFSPAVSTGTPGKLGDEVGNLKFSGESTSFVQVSNSQSPYTADESVSMVWCNVGNGPVTVYLDATPKAGQRLTVKHYAGDISSDAITVGRNGKLIDENSADVIMGTYYDTQTFMSDGTNWFTMAERY